MKHHIEQWWLQYMSPGIPANTEAWKQLKHAFYAGALALDRGMQAKANALGPDSAEGPQFVREFQKELLDFFRDVK